jgi:hypothetical protein
MDVNLLKIRISQGCIEDVLDDLITLVSASQKNTVYVLKWRHTSIKNESIKGTLNFHEYLEHESKTIASALQFIDQIS